MWAQFLILYLILYANPKIQILNGLYPVYLKNRRPSFDLVS